jgi:hypothetical protein
MFKVIRRKCIIDNGYVPAFRLLTTGIIVEELVRESLGRDGHKVFIEDEEVEGIDTQDADSRQQEIEPKERKRPHNVDSGEADTEAAIEL